MMNFYSFSKGLASFGYHQTKNILKLLLGYPLTTPSFNSATLDYDDIIIAKDQLRKRRNKCNDKRTFRKKNFSS